MNLTSDDILYATVAHAYGAVRLSRLCDALSMASSGGAEADSTANGLPPMGHLLVKTGALDAKRAAMLSDAVEIVRLFRDETIYGSILLRHDLSPRVELDAALETTRKSGHCRRLGQELVDRGVLTTAQHEQVLNVVARFCSSKDEVSLRLARKLAWSGTAEEVQVQVEILLGEMASQLDFITHEQVEQTRLKRLSTRVEDERQTLVQPSAEEAELTAVSSSQESAREPIPGYELEEKLGQGAMGAVFKARKLDIGLSVALKVLKPDLADDDEYVERFVREARAVAQLNHPHIVKCFDCGRVERTTSDGTPQMLYYYAMEWVDGETMGTILKDRGALPERLSLSVARQIALALAHAWQFGMVHRDIKPENIMLTRGRVAKLTDLGLAKRAHVDATLTMTGVVMGSPAYISPEQATGQKVVDCRSDIYSLGASLYHLLTGEVPYDADTPLQVMLKHINEPVPDPRRVVPSISLGTAQLVRRMLAKKPESRFTAPGDVAEAIKQVERALVSGLGGRPPEAVVSAADAAERAASPPLTAKVAKRASARASKVESPDLEGPVSGPTKGSRRAAAAKQEEKSPDRHREIGERLRRRRRR